MPMAVVLIDRQLKVKKVDVISWRRVRFARKKKMGVSR